MKINDPVKNNSQIKKIIEKVKINLNYLKKNQDFREYIYKNISSDQKILDVGQSMRHFSMKIKSKKTFNWGQLQSFTKTVETSSGSRVLLDNEMSLEPVIIFYPSGENTGAKLYFETIDKKLEIIISKNGKVIRVNE